MLPLTKIGFSAEGKLPVSYDHPRGCFCHSFPIGTVFLICSGPRFSVWFSQIKITWSDLSDSALSVACLPTLLYAPVRLVSLLWAPTLSQSSFTLTPVSSHVVSLPRMLFILSPSFPDHQHQVQFKSLLSTELPLVTASHFALPRSGCWR